MIYHAIYNRQNEVIDGCNIFNATLAELLMTARKNKRDFGKIERHGRRGFITYRMDGKTDVYRQM